MKSSQQYFEAYVVRPILERGKMKFREVKLICPRSESYGKREGTILSPRTKMDLIKTLIFWVFLLIASREGGSLTELKCSTGILINSVPKILSFYFFWVASDKNQKSLNGRRKNKNFSRPPRVAGDDPASRQSRLHVGTGTRACRQRAGPGSQLAAVAGNTEWAACMQKTGTKWVCESRTQAQLLTAASTLKAGSQAILGREEVSAKTEYVSSEQEKKSPGNTKQLHGQTSGCPKRGRLEGWVT